MVIFVLPSTPMAQDPVASAGIEQTNSFQVQFYRTKNLGTFCKKGMYIVLHIVNFVL